jgi:formylmethanofuran dehydrogenase subunit D
MEIKKTICPFCLNGCTSGVVFDGYQYRMEYPADGPVNAGKLCPRGNSAGIVIDHPKRLAYPLLDGKPISWDEANSLVKGWKAAVKPSETALVYSRGRSMSEVRRMHGLALELGTKNLACGHVEPENSFEARVEGVQDPTLEQVENAESMLLVGDVFNTSPVAVGRMLNARYASRKNRLVVIDSIKTRQSGFAHSFIQVRPGTEPFALVALAALIDDSLAGVDVDRMCEVAGVERGQLAAAAAMLSPDVPGFVGSAAHTGRVFHPLLHSLASQLVAVKSGKPFVGFRETGLPQGLASFADLRAAIADGRIRLLFWTGGLFPYSYADLMPELERVEYRVSTAIFIPDPVVPGLVFPMTAELEKASSGSSYWGPVKREPVAEPCSGTRDFARVIELFGDASEARLQAPNPHAPAAVVEMAARAAGMTRGNGEWLLIGEKKAIGLRGFHDPEDRVAVHPADAAKLGVVDGASLNVTSPTGELEFVVHVTDAVPAGAVMVGTNVHRNRTLFPLATDEVTGDVTVQPVNVKIAKAAGTVQPPTEYRPS